MNQPTEKPLATEIVAAWIAPLRDGLSEKARLSVAEHEKFINAISTPESYDEIDAELDELIEIDPYNRQPSSRKSDKEIARVLDILDNLPRGKDAE